MDSVLRDKGKVPRGELLGSAVIILDLRTPRHVGGLVFALFSQSVVGELSCE
jgi:hypothetical protein